MHAPVRPLNGAWPAIMEQRLKRFFWNNPTVIVNPDVSAADFRTAMSAIHVGDTIKITGANRHPEADALLIDNVDLADAEIVDIGASDGSTSVDLIGRLPGFGSYTIADLFFHISFVRSGRRVLFYDHDGHCILIVGPRFLAWPGQSKAVEFLYRLVIARAARLSGRRTEVLLLNPDAREMIRNDDRITYRVHDVFQPWTGKPPTVIKVANLLRRLYFSDEKIVQGLNTILQSLAEGGYLLMVDNHRIKGLPSRGGLYQRDGGRFTTVACTEHAPEIDDLIRQVGVGV